MNNLPLKIYFFYCSNSLDPETLNRFRSEQGSDKLKTISLPCSGKIDILYLIKAFETGADGVMLVTCKQGECRHLEGNLRAKKRAESVDSLLDEIGLSRGRIVVIQFKDEGGVKEISRKVEDFRAKIRDLSSKTLKLNSSLSITVGR
jgi:coenzyme F420-reducing hydrogenase delta subunit